MSEKIDKNDGIAIEHNKNDSFRGSKHLFSTSNCR